MHIKTTISVLFIIIISLQIIAENKVFTDDAFPYRIVCEPEWVETAKTGDTLTLEKTSPSKKMRFQLIKQQVDTSFYKEDMRWSLMNFMINKELASKTGRLIFFDTSATKKLGNHRAYEMFGFFCDTTGNDVWWADYCRWTDYDGLGYLVSIIGDTTEMKQNYEANQSLLDSINLTNSTTPVLHHRTAVIPMPTHGMPSSLSPTHYDILGRALPTFIEYRNRLMVNRKSKQCKIR